MKVFVEILLLGLHLSDPSIFDVSRREKIGDDIAPENRAPRGPAFRAEVGGMGGAPFLREEFSLARGTFLSMTLASLRYAVTESKLSFWRSDTALCGRCVDMG